MVRFIVLACFVQGLYAFWVGCQTSDNTCQLLYQFILRGGIRWVPRWPRYTSVELLQTHPSRLSCSMVNTFTLLILLYCCCVQNVFLWPFFFVMELYLALTLINPKLQMSLNQQQVQLFLLLLHHLARIKFCPPLNQLLVRQLERGPNV